MRDLLEEFLQNPASMDRVLHPETNGKYLHEADPESLKIEVMPSGFTETFDKAMVLKKGEGELIIFCGETSMGKSALMLKVAFNVSKDRPVHIFSLEDTYKSIVRRRIAGETRLSIEDIQRGMNPLRVIEALSSFRDRSFFVDDQGGLTVDQICERARNRYKKIKTELVVVDHLQLVSGTTGANRAQEIGEITHKLKCLGKELSCPVLLACQMNRQFSARENKKPMLTDLKESSSIEQNSDVVISVYREHRYTKLREFEADISILKNRNGPTEDYVFRWSKSIADFSEIPVVDLSI